MKFRIVILHLFFTCLTLCLYGQQTDELIKDINNRLSAGKTSISEVLDDTSFMRLHSLTAFREIIKQYAKNEKIKLNTAIEPGVSITIKGLVSDKSGNPQAGKLVYVYHTSSEGWYADTAPHILQNEGDRRHARLFGYFKTDSDGRFEFETIKPKGYPNSSLPAHIHIEITDSNKSELISELLFDDDPRLIGDTRKRSLEEGFLVSKNIGTMPKPVYFYKLVTIN